MSRLLPVVRREYLERVRSKLFVVSTLVGPLLVVGVTLVPGLLMQNQRGKPLRLAIVDETGALGPAAAQSLARRKAAGEPRFEIVDAGAGDAPGLRERLTAQVVAGTLDGFVVLPRDVSERSRAEYVA